MRVARPARRRQEGRGAGCVLVVLVAIVALCMVAFVGGRMVAQPDLGGAVRGPGHGDSVAALATWVAGEVEPQFLAHDHAFVDLSEHDLTVLARAHNPDPRRYSDPEVRLRDSTILLSANTTLGPLSVVAVAHIELSLSGVGADDAHVETQIVELDSGRQTIPDFLRGFIDSRSGAALALDSVFNSSASLRALRQTLECIYIGSDGVRIGFHRPGATPDANACVDAAGGAVLAPATTATETPSANP